MQRFLITLVLILGVSVALAQVPAPADTSHPGNETAVLSFERFEIKELGRTSPLYLPKRTDGKKVPLVVFGHGQALNETHYDKTLEHLAKKGVAALFPKFDDGFFDQNWRRMADDWNAITKAALKEYGIRVDAKHVVYSGHSKGGYVGLMAMGAPSQPAVDSGVFFAPAGYDSEYLQNLEDDVEVTLVWGEKDSVIEKSAVMEIYNALTVENKQFIEVLSYNNREADHYFPQNKSTFFGGKNGVSAFHHHGVWQWLVAAAWDVENGGDALQPYLYGEKAGVSGQPGLKHKVQRSWSPRFEALIKPTDANSFLTTTGRNLVLSEVGWGWYKAILSEQIFQRLQRSKDVQYVGRNHELKLLLEPNDLDPRQWAFKNPLGFDVSAPGAWDLVSTAEEVVVAVIDSGIQWKHSDLRDNLWINQAEAEGQAGVDDDNNGYIDDVKGFHFLLNNGESNDSRGHGTMVSGMIGAVGNNGRGITGMAWNVKLMSLNMFPNLWGNATLEAAVKAVHYAVDNKADIINASFGQADEDLVPDDGFKIFIEALERAEKAGIPVIAAAGNSSGNNDKTGMIPATLGLSNIISVGAMNRKGEKWAKTNYGKNSVHVMAPGEEILTTHTSGTRSPSGTSLSAPIVTGIVALMLDKNPDLTLAQIKDILLNSCDAHPPLAELSLCGGYINAAKAVEAANLK